LYFDRLLIFDNLKQ